MTIEQVKADILSDKSDMIIYSTSTLWWTHLWKDVEEATAQGVKAQDIRHAELLNDPKFPENEKIRLRALMGMMRKGHQTPLDPTGSPLMQIKECMDWVTEAEKKPEHFGRHGLKAFILAHHQNSVKPCKTWEEYNLIIDGNL